MNSIKSAESPANSNWNSGNKPAHEPATASESGSPDQPQKTNTPGSSSGTIALPLRELSPSPNGLDTLLGAWSGRWGNKEWDRILVAEILNHGLPRIYPKDAEEFSPRSIQDSTIFYANILVEMAKWESNWNPTLTFKEPNILDRFGNNVISTGLFQISVESLGGIGFPTTQAGLLTPEVNIRGAVHCFAYYVKKDQRIAGKINGKWAGAAKYWAVLRGTTEHTAKALAAIKRANK